MTDLKKTAAEGGPRRKLVGIAFEGKRTARQGNPIKSGGTDVGIVTSACLSPTLGYPIAMGFVDQNKMAEGTALQVDTGRAVLEGKIVKLPFYKAPK